MTDFIQYNILFNMGIFFINDGSTYSYRCEIIKEKNSDIWIINRKYTMILRPTNYKPTGISNTYCSNNTFEYNE